MGLQDRDYMRERRYREERPIWPKENKSGFGVIVGVALGIGIVVAGARVDHRLFRPRPAAPAAATVPAMPEPAAIAPPPIRSTMSNEPQRREEAPRRIAVKCIELDGSIAYVDSHEACAARARRFDVVTNQRLNVVDGMPPAQRAAVLQQGMSPPAPVAAQATAAPQEPVAAVADNRSVCAALDQRVQALDAYARQALPGWEQDRVRAERQHARDEQFRLRCQ